MDTVKKLFNFKRQNPKYNNAWDPVFIQMQTGYGRHDLKHRVPQNYIARGQPEFSVTGSAETTVQTNYFEKQLK